jgi:hypothetical protein
MTKANQVTSTGLDDMEAKSSKQMAWVADSYERVRTSRFGTFLVRRGLIYRQLAQLTDTSIIGHVALLWGLWALPVIVLSLTSVLHFATPALMAVLWLSVVVGAAVNVAVTMWTASWWRHYRQSEDQQRHRILARRGNEAGIAGPMEVRKKWSAHAAVSKASFIRPRFADRAAISRAYAVAPSIFRDEFTQLAKEHVAAHGSITDDIEVSIAEALARNLTRVAVPYTDPARRAA